MRSSPEASPQSSPAPGRPHPRALKKTGLRSPTSVSETSTRFGGSTTGSTRSLSDLVRTPVNAQPVGVRVASYNVRVDHHDDLGTAHEWSLRRGLVAASIRSLCADVVALQEPSPIQAADLQTDLGPEWGVSVGACDPRAWDAEPHVGPSDGQARDGNGFAWRRSRMQLLGSSHFWLSPSPEAPWESSEPAWGGSHYQRTCALGRFRDRETGAVIGVLSTHFDHEHDDSLSSGGSEARRQSAYLVMMRASQMHAEIAADVTVLCGDFNSFEDRAGATYAALLAAADGAFVDARDVPGCLEVDAGRGSASWEGWETNAWRRAVKGDQRYDQIFVSAETPVTRVAVHEERFAVPAGNTLAWAHASDHLPVVVDLLLPPHRYRLNHRLKQLPPKNAPKPKRSAKLYFCLAFMCLLCLFLGGMFFYLIHAQITENCNR
jgi:endonuclease/exonuclease/phosphatase family metal-dependent hydrolase